MLQCIYVSEIFSLLFFTALIVSACCVLHNMAIKWGIPNNEVFLDEIDFELPIPYNGCVGEERGEETRNRVIQWYFT